MKKVFLLVLFWLKRLAFELKRPANETELLESRSIAVYKVSVLVVLVSAVSLLLGIGVYAERGRFEEPPTNLRLPVDGWRVVYGSDNPATEGAKTHGDGGVAGDERFGGDLCAAEGIQLESCPAYPGNPILWKHGAKRSNPGHFELVRKSFGSRYWIGTVIEPELLKKAAGERSNHLILGFIASSHELFLDGNLMLVGKASDGRLPVVVTVPFARLKENRPLHLAISINYDFRSQYPDYLLQGRERFGTTADKEAVGRFLTFFNETRPAMLAILNLIIGAYFCFFWLSARRKQEYWYLAAFAMVHVVIQLTQFDAVFKAIGFEFTYD